MEAAERGEFVLGGCCVEVNSPNKICNDCKKEFGDFDKLPLSGFKSFELFIGGYSGPSHYIYLNGERKKKVFKYGYSADGRFINVKKRIPTELSDLDDIKLKQVALNESQWYDFLDDIEKCEIDYWNEKYCDPYILDGTQWSIVIKYSGGMKIARSGSNAYPPLWKKLLKVLRKYLNVDIG